MAAPAARLAGVRRFGVSRGVTATKASAKERGKQGLAHRVLGLKEGPAQGSRRRGSAAALGGASRTGRYWTSPASGLHETTRGAPARPVEGSAWPEPSQWRGIMAAQRAHRRAMQVKIPAM